MYCRRNSWACSLRAKFRSGSAPEPAGASGGLVLHTATSCLQEQGQGLTHIFFASQQVSRLKMVGASRKAVISRGKLCPRVLLVLPGKRLPLSSTKQTPDAAQALMRYNLCL